MVEALAATGLLVEHAEPEWKEKQALLRVGEGAAD